MSALILLLSVVLLFFVSRFFFTDERKTFIFAVNIWAGLLIILTELLSLFNLLSLKPVVVSWMIISIGCGIILFFLMSQRGGFKVWVHSFNVSSIFQHDVLLVVSILFIVVIVGLTGVFYVPNSVDSLAYHLARISHWLQNRSVDHYPTSVIRQLVMSPGSEFIMLHIILLSGNDKLASLMQWFSMFGSVIVSMLIGERLGANKKEQILAGVVTVTIPVGILEGSSTLNDYAVAFFILCFTYYALNLIFGDDTLSNKLGFGLSLGLAVCTKSTAFIYAAPLFLWLAIKYLVSRQKNISTAFLIAGFISVTLNLGHFARNTYMFGHPFGPPEETSHYTNSVHTPVAIVSNIVRNVSLQFSTPAGSINAMIEHAVIDMHTFLGVDINDPRTTYFGNDPQFQYKLSTQIRWELFASNTLHTILIIFAIMVFVFTGKKHFAKDDWALFSIYGLVASSMFFVFSFVLKWQPLHSRQLLPFFLHFSPFIAIVLNRLMHQNMVKALVVVMLIGSLPWVLFNQSRPFFSTDAVKNLLNTAVRKMDVPTGQSPLHGDQLSYGVFSDPVDQLFIEIQPLQGPLMDAVGHLDNLSCREFGLVTGNVKLEYPLWRLLSETLEDDFRLEHVLVDSNVSGSARENTFSYEPCVIISLRALPSSTMQLGDKIYDNIYTISNSNTGSCCTVSLYEKK